LICKIGDIGRFATARRLVGYFTLAPHALDKSVCSLFRIARNARVQRQHLGQGQGLRAGVKALQQLDWIGCGRCWRGFRHSVAIWSSWRFGHADDRMSTAQISNLAPERAPDDRRSMTA